MVYPQRLLVGLCLVPVAASVAVVFVPALVPIVLGIDLALALAALADSFTLPGRRRFEVSRDCARIASLGQTHAVVLRLKNLSRWGRRLELSDDVPQVMDARPRDFEVRVPGRSWVELRYELRPRERGAWTLERVYGRVHSAFGLWQRQLTWPVRTVVSVYPNLKQIRRYALYARADRLRLLGVRRSRRLGEDNEFERLRDYTQDDEHRHIDWRATARRRKLTVRDFQATRSQRLVVVVDCGRRMLARHDGLSLLDHALDAALMLAYVALRGGDEVGLLTFGDRVLGYVPPAGGRRQMDRLVHEAHDRFAALVEPRYDLAFRYLAHRCRKRTLVVLMTQLLDEVNALQARRQLLNLAGRHLPLAVVLRDPELFSYVEGRGSKDEARDGEALYQAAAAASILSWRAKVLRELEREGALILDVAPRELTPALVNEFLVIKARHLL